METITTAISLAVIAMFLCNLLHWRSRGGSLSYYSTSGWVRTAFVVWTCATLLVAILYIIRFVPASVSVAVAGSYGIACGLYSVVHRHKIQPVRT